MADRADRIAEVARTLGASLDPTDRATLDRAATLAKFDLASHMVIELTSLAGTMAREYATRAGEPDGVAQALYDMELPRSAGDVLPASAPGAFLSVADRFDLLAGLFGVDVNPTGSSDPFGLRRAALGAVAVLRAVSAVRSVTIERGLAVAADRLRAQGVAISDAALAAAADFVTRRYEQQLLDAGHDHRFVAAILPLADAPAAADETLAELERRAPQPEFANLAAAVQRVRRIVPADVVAGYDASVLTDPLETALIEAVAKVSATVLADFADEAAALVAPINAFFDGVLVMADDPAVRAARLGLLATIRDAADRVLDWQALGTLTDAG